MNLLKISEQNRIEFAPFISQTESVKAFNDNLYSMSAMDVWGDQVRVKYI